jgi:hypothetical protein
LLTLIAFLDQTSGTAPMSPRAIVSVALIVVLGFVGCAATTTATANGPPQSHEAPAG